VAGLGGKAQVMPLKYTRFLQKSVPGNGGPVLSP